MPVLSLDEARPHLEPLAPVALAALYESHQYISTAFAAFPDLDGDLDNSTKASMLSNVFAKRVQPRFAELGLNWQLEGRMQHGVVNHLINLRFKKLTAELHSMNVATDAQVRMYHQWRLPGFDALTQVTFGWVAHPQNFSIVGAFFICPRGFRSNYWSMPLLGGEGGMSLFGGMTPTDPDAFDPNLDVDVSINVPNRERA